MDKKKRRPMVIIVTTLVIALVIGIPSAYLKYRQRQRMEHARQVAFGYLQESYQEEVGFFSEYYFAPEINYTITFQSIKNPNMFYDVYLGGADFTFWKIEVVSKPQTG